MLVLGAATIVVAGSAAISGRYLTVLIESPLIAPTRESPALWILVVAGLWLFVTGVAVGVGELAGNLARLRGPLRRRWRWIYLGAVLAIWTVMIILYVADPMTALRWQRH